MDGTTGSGSGQSRIWHQPGEDFRMHGDRDTTCQDPESGEYWRTAAVMSGETDPAAGSDSGILSGACPDNRCGKILEKALSRRWSFLCFCIVCNRLSGTVRRVKIASRAGMEQRIPGDCPVPERTIFSSAAENCSGRWNAE